MSENAYSWLILEPYVQLIEKNGKVLFYNTLSKKVLEFETDVHILPIIKNLTKKQNGYVVRISENTMNHASVMHFVHELRRLFMADIWPVRWSKAKPVNVLPEPVIKYGFHNKLVETKEYLSEITLHLNTEAGNTKTMLPEYGFKQFNYPKKGNKKSEELDLRLIKVLIAELSALTQLKIRIVGSDITKFTSWPELHEILKNQPFSKEYHFLISQFNPEYINIFERNSRLVFIVSEPSGEKIYEKIDLIRSNAEKRFKPEFNFIVENLEDLDRVLVIIQELQLKNAYFKPYYNGHNQSFFDNNVFLDQEDIFLSKPEQNQIFSRKLINENDFGKLTVVPGGDVFANVNDRPIGNLNKHSVNEIISRELKIGKSWKRTRMKVNPCQNCIYQWLCPPVSNYEIFMKRFNFCHIYP